MDPLLKSLRDRGVVVVEFSGPPSDLAIVGEALGAEEVSQLRPFAGAAGYTLDAFLKQSTIDRPTTFITNVVPIRPPNNDLERLGELGVSLPDFYPSLRDRLLWAKPKVVLALGGRALEALTGKTGIFDYRGSILESTLVPGLKVVPTIHPAALNRMGDDAASASVMQRKGSIRYDYGATRAAMGCDFRRAKEESRYVELRLPVRNLLVADSYDLALRCLSQVASSPYLSFDLETSGTAITHIGLAPSGEFAFSIPLTSNSFSVTQKEEVVGILRKMFAHHPGLIAQNGQFDMTMLLQLAPVGRLHFDTLLAHHRLYAELPHSLDFLSSIYTREPYYKHEIHLNKAIYNCKDAAVTWEVAARLKEELREFSQEEAFYGFVMPLAHTVMRMMWRGVGVDSLRLEEVRAELEKKSEVDQEELTRLAGRPLNANSPKQLKEYLYGELSLGSQRHRKTGKETVDEEALNKLFAKTNNPILQQIIQTRETRKMLGTYARSVIDPDGRVRTAYSVSGTDSGRLSSRKTIYGTGMNLQNQPPSFRKMFVPDEGKVLVEADLKQAEAMLVAWFSQDPAMMETFQEGKDIHTWNAARIFGKPPGEVTKEERYLAKRMVHALNYGLGPGQFSVFVSLPLTRAKELTSLYFQAFPSIKDWHRWIEEEVGRSRTLVNPYGRPRIFFGRLGPDLYRKAYSFLPQSTCVDYLNLGLVRLEPQLPEGAEVLLQVHDSIVIQCRKEDQDTCVTLIQSELKYPVVIHSRELVIPVEVKVSPTSWGEMVEL